MKSSVNHTQRGALALMAASGLAALSYQIIWTQQTALWLGHEAPAVLAVVSAFFGGLAFGGLLLGKRIEQSAAPRRWYVGCELVIAGWSPLLLWLWPIFSDLSLAALGLEPSPVWQAFVAFFGTFVLLLPATAAMGATLPAMERLTAGLVRGVAATTAPETAASESNAVANRSVSTLYAANTLGAVLGVLGCTFVFIPEWGLTRTAWFCAGLNVACATLSLVVFPKLDRAPLGMPVTEEHGSRGVLWRLGLTGFLGIGYEMLVVRVLSQVTENTVYTFALLLAVYLVGTALGAAAYHRWLERREPAATGETLMGLLSAACSLGTASLWGAEQAKAAAADWLGSSVSGAIGAEVVLALIAFGLPTLLMGALFSHLCKVALGVGESFGKAAGVNVLAAALAPRLLGVLGVPWFGAKWCLLGLCFGYLAATPPRAWRTAKTWAPAALAGALLVLTPPLRYVDVPEGGRIASYREGAMAAVSVIEEPSGALHLRINNRQQEGSSVTRYVDARQAWLPLALHPAPKKALFLGIGTGVTASAAIEDPDLHVDAVELLPEVIEASARFSTLVRQAGERVRVFEADARRFVRSSSALVNSDSDDSPNRKAALYDVIVADNFHPARSGSGSLYTVEHFRAVRARMADGAVFCQWLPLHQLDLETLRHIVTSFLEVFPTATALLASNSLETPVIGLAARLGRTHFHPNEVVARITSARSSHAVRALGLEDEFAVLGSFFAGPHALAWFAAGAAANTDDRPLVAYRAPLLTYAATSRPSERLMSLLKQVTIESSELVEPDTDPRWAKRIEAYWGARKRYIEAGQDVRPAARVQDMLAQVKQPLLEVLALSPDFRPAYDPLLGMANALARSDVDGARRLLALLQELQPERNEATESLMRLDRP